MRSGQVGSHLRGDRFCGEVVSSRRPMLRSARRSDPTAVPSARHANFDGDFILVVRRLSACGGKSLKSSSKLLELDLPEHSAPEPKLPYLAWGESASQLRFVHGFKDEFEYEYVSCRAGNGIPRISREDQAPASEPYICMVLSF